MAIDVHFYRFAKKKNSTKQPGALTPTTYSCSLKDPCGVTSPVLLVDTSSVNPATLNYAFIPAFGRYYYVGDWVSVNGLWEVTLNVDPLASFKTDIGASSQYVLRAASAYDGDIPDGYYATKAGLTRSYSAADADPWTGSSLVLGIYGRGDETANMGAVQYFALSTAQAKAFYTFLLGSSFNNIIWQGLEIIDEAIKATFNPLQYIASAMWFPFNAAALGTAVNSVSFGKWSLPVSATLLPSVPVYSLSSHVAVTKHPQASTRGAYLNSAPYMRYDLIYQPYGSIPLDATQLKDVDSLSLYNFVDLISGEGCLNVVTRDGNTDSGVIRQVWAQIGVPVALSQTYTNMIPSLTSAYDSAKNLVAGDIMGAAGSLVSAIQAAFPQVQTSGANGSTLPYLLATPGIMASYFTIVDGNDDHAGRPLCQERVINTLSGFIKCMDGEIDIAATDGEITAISTYLTGGFFYE